MNFRNYLPIILTVATICIRDSALARVTKDTASVVIGSAEHKGLSGRSDSTTSSIIFYPYFNDTCKSFTSISYMNFVNCYNRSEQIYLTNEYGRSYSLWRYTGTYSDHGTLPEDAEPVGGEVYPGEQYYLHPEDFPLDNRFHFKD